ncbi:DoxX family protein [Xylanibacillus composti]|uniref:Membrane protein n=1 Tax=Xylanibacillus composti TaxID=1572762 RepID=A0A8J4H881_9BACL|nr:DoxX family protein [Xylanibacillus composti]MDT9727178.1 DoxX family protein [Xylanibacillus composti]GIQ70413.1 membrane protein [Xylanibacillus composti]
MTKRNKILYWIATIWLALGMLSTGIVQLLKLEGEVDMMSHLGYPSYFLTILGVSKILGVAAILIPKFPLLKEWAYAGFFFTIAGAVISHMALGDPIVDILPVMLLFLLTAASWYFRPANRKIASASPL